MQKHLSLTGYRPDIQALRGFAVLAVVAYHANLPISGGFAGVDIFFVISGFVITQVIDTRFSQNTFSFRSFFEKRILRLVPLLTLVNVVISIVAIVALSPFGEIQQVAEAFKFATFFSANLYFFKTNNYLDLSFHPLRHLWSLGVEEQFYLIFPVFLMLLLVTSRKLNRPQLVLIGLSISSALSLILCLIATRNLNNIYLVRFAFYGTPLRAWEFLVGGITYFLISYFPSLRLKAISAFIVGFGLLLMVIGISLISTSNGYPNLLTLLPVLGTSLVIFGGTNSNAITGYFSNRLLVRLGDLSYGWYLWHWPIVVFTQRIFSSSAAVLTIASILSLFVSILTHRYFENPIRHSNRLAGRLSWFVLAACTIVSLATIAIVNRAAESGLGVTVDKPENVLIALGACYSGSLDKKFLNQCDNGLSERGESVLLIGDSQAQSAADGLYQAGHELGVRVFGYGAAGCPMRSRSTVKESAWCPSVQNTYVAAVERFRPVVVVFANRYDQYVVEGSQNGPNDLRVPFADGRLPVNRSEQIDSVITSLIEQVTAVRNLGSEVLILLDTPTASMPPQNVLSNFYSVETTELSAAKEFNTVRDEVNVQILKRLHGIGGVMIIDPREYLCQSYPKCSAVIDGNVAYWEKQHVNRFGSLRLVPLWKSALTAIYGGIGD